ncbi:MAG: mechanosensitive ion channel family protein [Anaerolineae bacterium]|nr:mechanosensitive ion channel family protein [Anaerolineae bacterium]
MGISQAWLDMWTKLQNMIADFFVTLPQIALSIIVLGLFYVAANWIKSAVRRVAGAADLGPGAEMVLGRLARWLVIGVGILVSLTIAVESFQPGQLIQLLGIGSVAIGFAFHDILQNFLAGILLLLTEPFEIGDEIIVDEFEGRVENVETRATTLKTYDGRRVVIPNAHLFTESVIVNTAFPVRRTEYQVGIGYSDDVADAMRLILEAMGEVDGVLMRPAPDVLVAELGDFSVNLRARWWTDSVRSNLLQIQSEVISLIKERLLARGIDLPFPTQQVLFHDQTEETDGDRLRQREGWPSGEGAAPEPHRIGMSLDHLGRALKEREASQDEVAG